MNRKLTITGVIFVLTAIILGAFGAHLPKEILSTEKLASFETGVRYQMYQGLGMLLVGLAADRFKYKLNAFYILMLFGTVFFSGSIYFLALQEPLNISLGFLGPVTPIGGLLMIAAWIWLLIKMNGSKT